MDEKPSLQEDYLDKYIDDTEEYERIISRLVSVKGERLEDIVEESDVDITLENTRLVTRFFVSSGLLLIEDDGEPGNPRLYTHTPMNYLQSLWQKSVQLTVEERLDKIQELETDIESYKETTGYENASQLLTAIKDSSEDLDDIDYDGEYGELFWDLYTPWATAETNKYYFEKSIELNDELEEATNRAPMNVTGIFGDFNNLNDLDEKLGIE